jgi:hypothetical protein
MNKIKEIEKYGRLYIDRFLRQQIVDKETIYNNWYEALKFFFTKSFSRGRRNELSERFMKNTIRTLEEYKLTKNSYEQKLLDSRLTSNGVNNRHDRQMVLGVIDLVFNSLDSYENNIVQYTVNQIKEGKIADVFSTLDGIHAIGDKLASLYLRDVILIYQLEKSLKSNDEFKYCQPIDTWVKQVAFKVGIIKSEEAKIEDIKGAIIKSCLNVESPPLLFNAGAWMVGANSFELLIERL